MTQPSGTIERPANAGSEEKEGDAWACAHCRKPNVFDAELGNDGLIPDPLDENDLPYRCASCGRVSIITAEIVSIRYVVEPADDDSTAVNDDDEDDEEDLDDEEDDNEEDDDDLDDHDLDDEEDDNDEDDNDEDDEEQDDDDLDDDDLSPAASPEAYGIAASPNSDRNLTLKELHAGNPTITKPIRISERPGSIVVHPACKGLHSAAVACRGRVEPCARCGRPRCYVEGTSELGELCDECWDAVVLGGAWWPTLEAFDSRMDQVREEMESENQDLRFCLHEDEETFRQCHDPSTHVCIGPGRLQWFACQTHADEHTGLRVPLARFLELSRKGGGLNLTDCEVGPKASQEARQMIERRP